MANSEISINLMNEYVRQLKNRRLLFTKVQFYAGGILIVYLAGLFSVLAYRGILAFQLNQVEQTIDQTKARINQLKPLEMKYYFIQNKLSLMTDFWSQRKDVRSFLTHLGAIIPEEVRLESVAYSESTQEIEIVTVAKDVFTTMSWLSVLETEVKNKAYEKAAVGGLSRTEEGEYSVSINFSLAEG